MAGSLADNRELAFSIAELLVVIAIAALLAAAAIPAFNAMAATHSTHQCAYDLVGVLEKARSEAVARKTYVWVGVAETNRSGVDEVLSVAVFSKDGSGTNAGQATWVASFASFAPPKSHS